MKNLIIALGISFAMITTLVVRYRITRTTDRSSFERKYEGLYKLRYSFKVPSKAFDRIRVYKECIVLYSSKNRLVQVYNKKGTLISEAYLPFNSATIIDGQINGNKLILIDYRHKVYSIILNKSPFQGSSKLACHIDTINSKISYERALLINDSTLIAKGPSPEGEKNHVYSLCNYKSGKVYKIISILPRNNDYGFNTDGIFVKDSMSLYYKCYLNSQVYSFTNKGFFLNAFHEINNANKNYSIKSTNNNVTFSEPINSHMLAVTASGGRVYVVSNKRPINEKTDNPYIDEYNEHGKYLGSMMINNDGQYFYDFVKNKDSIFLLYDDTISNYNIN